MFQKIDHKIRDWLDNSSKKNLPESRGENRGESSRASLGVSSEKTGEIDHKRTTQLQLKILGPSPKNWAYLCSRLDLLRHKDSDLVHFFVLKSESLALSFYQSLSSFINPEDVSFLPGLDVPLYDGFVPSESDFISRLSLLQKVSTGATFPRFVVLSFESFLLKNPPIEFFQGQSLKLSCSDILSPQELSDRLIEMGYQKNLSAEEPGSFASRGEVFDIFPLGHEPVRIHYFDEMIEEIFLIDSQSNRTIRENPLESVLVGPFISSFTSHQHILNFREQLLRPLPGEKERYKLKQELLEKLNSGILFEGYPLYSPLFFKSHSTLVELFTQSKLKTCLHLIDSHNLTGEIDSFLEKLNEEYLQMHPSNASQNIKKNKEGKDSNNKSETTLNLLPSPDFFYFNPDALNKTVDHSITLDELEVDYLDSHPENSRLDHLLRIPCLGYTQFISNFLGLIKPSKKDLLEALSRKIERLEKIELHFESESLKEEFNHLLEQYPSILSKVEWVKSSLKSSLFLPNQKILVLCINEVLKRKLMSSNSPQEYQQKNLDLFAEQISSLKENDYVIHSVHGLGRFSHMESLVQNGHPIDFMVIVYQNDDKIFVPLYKMNLVQKHADAQAELSLNNLRTNKFKSAKQKARESAKALAFDLLELQAKRETSQSHPFSAPGEMFYEFEKSFRFKETPDQSRAINSVIKDMQKTKPMDHLVCGDVGFGKTEIAIRACYLAALDHKQVCILVPTTVLVLQHYQSFKNRFNSFGVNVDYLSRFKKPKEAKETLQKLAEGKVDIIIGTHKLLSDKVKFFDLGLVVVDEEHRFGVNHKEKLKTFKANVDFLTLSATPIPRTLHLAYLGLRDLSLIKTAPPRRQSIKTYVVQENDKIIQDAINKELSRGGQTFIVHNKVQDIENFAGKIKQLAPKAKLTFAHGQMNEKELEDKIAAFYSGDYDVLISTTIIESGIDIPNANTMIIDRADTYGLAQLHQLRGRIGRSDRKAYAYFLIPSTGKLSSIASKRLQALQNYSQTGSGFAIASSDLDIRGAGDILGAKQSGHLNTIGLELYTELLKEAIAEIKGKKEISSREIEINANFQASIPKSYIKDDSLRLKYYKLLSNSKSLEELETKLQETQDFFGTLPKEVMALEKIIRARLYLKNTGIKQLQLVGRNINIQFDSEVLDQNTSLRDKIVTSFVGDKSGTYRFSPDFKLSYLHEKEITPDDFTQICQKIAGKIVPK